MKLTLTTRALGKKSSLKQMRHLRGVPGILYSMQPGVSIPVSVEGEALDTHLRAINKGSLATIVFEIDLDGKNTKAIVKQIQYDPITYAVLHIDFQEVENKKVVHVNVPIVCTNQDQCAGVKLGGQVKFVKRSVKVTCLLENLPEAFYIDMQAVGIGEVRRVRDLQTQDEVRVITDKNNVLVSVAK